MSDNPAKCFITVDVSGSMLVHAVIVKAALKRKHPGMLFHAFHHVAVRNGIRIPNSQLFDEYGLTDLSIPFVAIQDAISRCVDEDGINATINVTFLTDGGHNASSPSVFYASMASFIDSMKRLPPTVNIRFNTITCGEYFDKSLASALPAIRALISEQKDGATLTFTQTTIEEFERHGYNEPCGPLDLVTLAGKLSLLKHLLPDTEKKSINDFVATMVRNQEALETKERPPQQQLCEQPITNHSVVHEWANGVKPANTRPASLLSAQIMEAFNASPPGYEPPKSNEQELKEAIVQCVLHFPPEQMTEDAACSLREQLDNGSFWFIYARLMDIIPICVDGPKSRMIRDDYFEWVSTNTPKYVFVVPKKDYPSGLKEYLPRVLHSAQQTFCKDPNRMRSEAVLFLLGKPMTLQTRRYTKLLMRTIAKTYLAGVFPSEGVFYSAIDQMIEDRFLPQ
jgi:hypothetical protein